MSLQTFLFRFISLGKIIFLKEFIISLYKIMDIFIKFSALIKT